MKDNKKCQECREGNQDLILAAEVRIKIFDFGDLIFWKERSAAEILESINKVSNVWKDVCRNSHGKHSIEILKIEEPNKKSKSK